MTDKKPTDAEMILEVAKAMGLKDAIIKQFDSDGLGQIVEAVFYSFYKKDWYRHEIEETDIIDPLIEPSADLCRVIMFLLERFKASMESALPESNVIANISCQRVEFIYRGGAGSSYVEREPGESFAHFVLRAAFRKTELMKKAGANS